MDEGHVVEVVDLGGLLEGALVRNQGSRGLLTLRCTSNLGCEILISDMTYQDNERITHSSSLVD